MKTPTKKQKLEWIRKAQIEAHRGISDFGNAYTCVCFLVSSSDAAMFWYEQVTLRVSGSPYSALSGANFDVYTFDTIEARNNARLLWLAMLETLVEAGEI